MNIKQLLQRAKRNLPAMRQADFLKKIGCKPSTYDRIMTGKRGAGIRVIELNRELEGRINELLNKNN